MVVNKYIQFVGKGKCEICEETIGEEAFTDDSVGGRTLYSLISSGTEINSTYKDVFDWGYPRRIGYAAVFEVDYVGSNVKNINIGDKVFTMGGHQSYQLRNEESVIKICDRIDPKDALFCRMAGVSMATLSRTAIKPGEFLLVTGLGAVGIIAMQIYSNLGYYVIGVDVNENRVNLVRKLGFNKVYTKVPLENEEYKGQIGLALECSGNETCVLDCCKAVRPHGEVSLVGVPWEKLSDMNGFELLNTIFYNYVKLYSGWELDLPLNSSKFVHESMRKNYKLALDMIAKERISVHELYSIKSYKDAQNVYDSIYNKTEDKISVVFDWGGGISDYKKKRS